MTVANELKIETHLGQLIAYRPTREDVDKTREVAKGIFQEAVATTYSIYHQKSQSTDPIETWLKLKEGYTLSNWLNDTFDEEYTDYLKDKKEFIYLKASDGHLMGWLSHGPISEKGDVYLSQGCLEAATRGQKIASAVFTTVINYSEILFPGANELRLIARKINEVAYNLYTRAGFTVDESMNPEIFGGQYDHRYRAFRLPLLK